MLGQHGVLAEGVRLAQLGIVIVGAAPALRLQHVDHVLPLHQVDEEAAHRFAHLLLLVLAVQ